MTNTNKPITNTSSQSQKKLLPIVNSDVNTLQKVLRSRVLPIFSFINMTIFSGITIHTAYNNNDTSMIVFITFIYFSSFLLDYLSRLCHNLPLNSPKRRNVKMAIWALMSSVMLGFVSEVSTVMSLSESICFFGVVIGVSVFVFYASFVRGSDNNGGACNNGNGEDKEDKPLIQVKVVDNV